ncbi:MAG: S-layer homology domain-containing protein, partial [Oscillospiraceae bacterium]|nr:S-layer homology domain-containing protein [Oscillospiraceae bacterium]
STIENNIQTAINSAKSSGADTVTVTGSKTGVSDGNSLELTIPEGVKVLWQAEYADNGLFTSGLISLSGAGTFEVGEGGSISSSSSRNSNSINIYSLSIHITVTVSDAGKVQTTGDCAIYTKGTVLVTGGEVSATSGTAIIPSGSTVTVSGGSVSAMTGKAIVANQNSAVTVIGGLVFAYGSDITGIGNVIQLGGNASDFTGASGTGVIIAWNQGEDTTTYVSGTTTDITLSPAPESPDSGATAVWATREGQNGIAYENGENTGFIPLEVTVLDLRALGELITQAGEIIVAAPVGDGHGQYAQEDVDAFAAVIAAAKTVHDTPVADNTQIAIDDAEATLQAEIETFNEAVIIVDFYALDTKLAEAKAIKLGNYVTSTCDALQAAISDAETMRNTQYVTQEEVNGALDALISAIDGLRHIYIPPPENNNNKNDDADEPTETPERPAATPGENPFDDVGQNDWFYEDVMFAYSRGLMTGTSARKFSPDAPMARGMIVTVLHRLEAEPAARGATTFSDVADGKYYTGAVAWAEAEGIVDGYGNGLFGPEDDITRQDLALLFLRYARYKGLTLPEIRAYADFADDKDVSEYARTAARTLYKAGIISGKPGSRLDPKGTATRAEVAAMLRRFLESVQQ